MLDERGLHWMKLFAIGQAFDRGDLIAFMHDRESETGIDASSVYQNRARATLAVIAAFFRTGEMQSLTQGVEQRHPRIDIERMFFSVDLELHLN